jgi:hypothetical protein
MNTLMIAFYFQTDPAVQSFKNEWIGFATVVATIILGMIRQELVARRTAEKVEHKTEETRTEVKRELQKTTETAKQAAVEHAEEIKTILKENATVVADAAVSRYEDAAIWRQYVDQQIKLFNQGNERLANIMRRVELIGLGLKNQQDALDIRLGQIAKQLEENCARMGCPPIGADDKRLPPGQP